jgi:hypothetical protein
MKFLKGFKRRYFKLSIIAMYSTWHKLAKIEAAFEYHKKALEYQEYKTSPPQKQILF